MDATAQLMWTIFVQSKAPITFPAIWRKFYRNAAAFLYPVAVPTTLQHCHGGNFRNMTKSNINKLSTAIKCGLLTALLLLASCRMPVVIIGDGYLYGAFAKVLYENGYLFDIQEDFDEKFWPIPAPGHSFKWWSKICKGQKPLCRVTLEEDLWGLDEEMPLQAVFEPVYKGPLELTNYSYFWNANSGLLRILRDSIELNGAKSGAPIRYFAATTDLEIIIPAKVQPSELEFQFPGGLDIDDIALFVSTVDTNNTLASVGPTFGITDVLFETELSAYNPASPYADLLPGCVRADDPFNICTLAMLPYLGLETDDPSVSEILKRTVVSHQWMGKNFRSILEALPAPFFKQFRGVTAVVIAANIRPSFFNPVTGVIHIDPLDLWLTESELNSVSEDSDPRSGFGSALNFIDLWEYEFQGGLAWNVYDPATDPPFRSVNDILWPFSTTLIHELAHANDAAPPPVQAQLGPGDSPLDTYLNFESQSPSTHLDNTYPLNSNLLEDVSGVLFRGDTPSEQIKALTAVEVGDEFEADGATDLYNYFTRHEDTAMLVEEVLSYYFFGIRRIVAFLEIPDNPTGCNDFIVGWGQRNRAGDDNIKERARLVLSGLLDEGDVSEYLDGLPAPYDMNSGVGYCESFLAMPNFAPTQNSTTLDQLNARTIRGRFEVPRGPFHQKETPLSGKTFLRQSEGGVRH
jgi:hypothetical protein